MTELACQINPSNKEIFTQRANAISSCFIISKIIDIMKFFQFILSIQQKFSTKNLYFLKCKDI